MRRIIALTLGVGLLAAACTSSNGATTTSVVDPFSGTTLGGVSGVAERFDPSSIRFEAALQRFDSCDALLSHFQAAARERVGPYGLDGRRGPDFPVFAEEMAMEGDDVATTTAAAEAPQAGFDGDLREGVDYSGTNVQVAGVDEPDIIKTDGTRILTIVDGKLSYFDVSGAAPELAGTLQMTSGWNHAMLVVGDRAYVMSSGDGVIALPSAAPDMSGMVLPYWGQSSVIAEVDLSDPAAMKVVRTLTVEGRYLSARLIDGTVRMVVSSYPNDLDLVYPTGPGSEDIAEEANRKIIDQTTIEDWLPEYTLIDEDGTIDTGVLVQCDRAHAPVEFAGFSTLSVLSFDADEGVDTGDGTAVIAEGETVYASAESIYVATNVWVPSEMFGDERLDVLNESYSTAIHKFSIEGNDPAEYEASGSVRGHLLNQFSMDEYEGFFRVATTDGPPWGFEETSESYVAVLEQQGERLVEVDRVGEMGRGERIFSVRFIGDAAYVVTFRQTDPLYVVDLSDPEDLQVTGELEIPGYSAYLHPIGNGRLIGVGQDADEDGRTLGAKVSVFDVSDPSDPKEVDVWVVEDSYTDAEWDHHAFLYWAPEDLAVLPLQNWQEDFAGAIVLKTDDGVREVGRISHEKQGGSSVLSECEQFTPPDDYEDVIVQICGPNDMSAVDGYYCEVLPAEEAEWIEEGILGGEADLAALVGPEDHIELCWPEYEDWNPIQRSLVIGDDLWTLSWRTLQSNALDDLTLNHQLNLG